MRATFSCLWLAMAMLPGFAQSPGSSAAPPSELDDMAQRGYQLLADTTATPDLLAEGFELTREAALRGSPKAQANMGYMYAGGLEGVVGADAESALYWYTEALKQGWPPAGINLIALHEQYPSLHIEEDVLAEAHFLMAEAYARGVPPVPLSPARANSHYLQAARLGNGRALGMLRELLGMFPDALGRLSDEDLKLIYP